MNLFNTIKLCLPLLLTLSLVSPSLFADGDNAGLTNRFMEGQRAYATGDFEDAIQIFTDVIETDPLSSEYHHWLGKSYGRLAEKSNLLKAYDLSKKTRVELERAVELDNTNIDALSDLKEYYTQAPSFLGGGKDKARAIDERIVELQNENVAESP